MSDTGDKEGGGTLVPFPRVVLPSSLDAPGPGPEPSTEDDPAVGGPAPVGAWPRLPAVTQMGPPLHLTVPATPSPAAAPADEDADVFTPPGPEDPDNPRVRDTLAVAVALVTALGVAAAQAMWQRARHRQALADKARGGADTSTRSATTGSGGAKTARGAGGSGSLLRSPGGDSKKDKGKNKSARAFPRRPGGGGDGSGPPGRGKDSKAPRAGRDGKTDRKDRKDRDKPGRTKGGSGKDGLGTRLRRRLDAADRGLKKLKRAKGGPGKPTPDSKAPGSPGRRLTWKAPKDGADKTLGRKRWARTGQTGSGKRRGWRSGVAWLKRWRAGRAGETPSTATASETTEATAQETGTPKTPPPPPGFGGMRPPPGAGRAWVTAERVDRPAPRQDAATALAGAPAAGRPELPAGTADAPAANTPPPPPPAPQEGPFVSTPTPTRTTQYTAGGDVDLSIYDVIDADADMAAEIVDGVSDAQATAEGCELLLTRLEELHAKVVELQVPGVLEGMVVALMEQTSVVKAKAEAIAEKLPAAAEAIATAGSNAEVRHRNPADVTRDMGHSRPAERDYHTE